MNNPNWCEFTDNIIKTKLSKKKHMVEFICFAEFCCVYLCFVNILKSFIFLHHGNWFQLKTHLPNEETSPLGKIFNKSHTHNCLTFAINLCISFRNELSELSHSHCIYRNIAFYKVYVVMLHSCEWVRSLDYSNVPGTVTAITTHFTTPFIWEYLYSTD